MPDSMLRQLQTRFGAQLEGRIRAWLQLGGTAEGFASMMRYQMGYVDEALRPVSMPGGKLFRPLLCLLACEAAGSDATYALNTAAAIELLHNFSLIHDDIEDRDETRRHRPTVWKLWGDAQGINVGDGMFALAFSASLGLQDPIAAVEVAHAFGKTAVLLTEGQYLDMSFETRADVSHDEYLEMIEKKSAALVEFAVWSGARVGGANGEQMEHLRRFGRSLGTAFQICDDVKGIWGKREATGKRAGTDLENRKKTLPVLLGAEKAGAADASLFRAYLSGDVIDTSALQRALDRLCAADEARRIAAQHRTDAIRELQLAHVGAPYECELQAIADELTSDRDATS